MKTGAGRTLAAVGEAQHRIEALKSRIKDLVLAIPLTQRRRLEDSTCAVQAEICALQVAVWRIAGDETSPQSSGQGSAPVGMKGGAQIQKAKHTLIRGCLHRKAVDATVSALMPAIFVSIESLLLTVESQGYILGSDSALQNLRVSCSKARSGVDPHHKLLQAQSASARALMSTKRKVLTLKEWKRQVFPDIWGCRRKKLTGLKVRRPVRVLPDYLCVCLRAPLRVCMRA